MPFIDRPNYLPVDLKPFQGMDVQHLNHVLCELISHKKILVKIWFFLLQTTKRSSVVWLTPKLNSGLKNYNFLQNIFSFGLVDDQKSFNAACHHIFLQVCAARMDFLF